MRRPQLVVAAGVLLLLAACGSGCGDSDDDQQNPDTTADTVGGGDTSDTVGGSDTTDTGGGDTGGGDTGGDVIVGPPAPPALGVLIDRMGRPGITTALVGTFDPTNGGATKDDYNDDEPANWALWSSEIAANLAIYDSLDGTCGTQLLVGTAGQAGAYDTLAGALADDRLYVNTGSTTCTTYLAVEAAATGVLDNTDCGGRAPGYDVLDVTYSALAAGALSGVSDGVDADDGTVAATFPFLAEAGAAFGPAPALGGLIDRMGRPAITTALIGTFDPTNGGASKDDYNDDEPADWSGWSSEIAANLAIYDSLDGTCGSQLLVGTAGQAGAYDTLAGALADDRLYVNTSSTTCTTYLAVEAQATGVLDNADCGGRAPGYDVLDVTYSALAAGALAGVSDGVDGDDGAAGADFPYLADAGPAFGPPPAIGGLIDRMGRPGITTALVGTFDPTNGGGAKDDYNADEPSDWASWSSEIAANLAIYDSLDGTCGTQLLAGTAGVAGAYGTLAGALADDRLYVNTASTTCTTYLAVEADATNVLANNDCGGRAPGYDVLDVTYSALAAGALSGVGDGVAGDDGAPGSAFPFLAEAGPAFGPAPVMGTLIDRMGRPAITTALVGTFDPTNGGDAKDEYNGAEPADWSSWVSEIAANLAIYDSLDGTCGTQLLAGTAGVAGAYDTLAGALADDRLYVNTASTTCTTYLAVEADATAVLANSDCGGRAPDYDVLDVTYSALAAGALSGVGDGVDADDDTPSGSFPYLAAEGAPFGPPPVTGTLIDRMGRPAVTTALIGTFDPTNGGDAKDDYNQDEPGDWASWTSEIAANLGVYDALDGTCGTQLLAGTAGVAGAYNTLAGALADDRLYLNTGSTTCTTYLAVEADATGVLTNTDCGGRAPGYDVIDITYSAVAAGALSGVTDGISMDDGTVGTAFPYLDATP